MQPAGRSAPQGGRSVEGVDPFGTSVFWPEELEELVVWPIRRRSRAAKPARRFVPAVKPVRLFPVERIGQAS